MSRVDIPPVSLDVASQQFPGAAISPPRYDGGSTICHWEPEDEKFWTSIGRRVARRNLWISIPALFLAFALWMVWSTLVVELPNIGFAFTTDQLFWLVAMPGLSGATLRIFYAFLVPVFGGRNWTVISTASLLIPAIGMGFAVRDASTPYWIFLTLALLCGLGGGSFASSMANISFFFPKAQKGTALGLNAGLGNLGVSAAQFIVPLVIGASLFGATGSGQELIKSGISRTVWMQNAAWIWVPFIIAATLAAFLGMNNLSTARASFREQSVIFGRKHNWIMCWLYTGTFGSFIGYSAGFPLLIKTQFEGVNPLAYAFLGPLVGALARPAGGWLSDKFGGARVTFWNFLIMTGAVAGVIYFLAIKTENGAFAGLLTMFLVLFFTTGIGNGSTFRMVPVIFSNVHERLAAAGSETIDMAKRNSAKESAAVLGFISAIAAYGAFVIPKTFGYSIKLTGAPFAALVFFIAFYLSCLAITWWCYARRGAEAPC